MDQVLHKGVHSTRIVHQRTMNTNPGPLVFGPQSRDVVCRPTYPLCPPGSNVYILCVVHRGRAGVIRPLPVSYFCLKFCLFCYGISDCVLLPSLLPSVFRVISPKSHHSRAISIFLAYAFFASHSSFIHPTPRPRTRSSENGLMCA